MNSWYLFLLIFFCDFDLCSLSIQFLLNSNSFNVVLLIIFITYIDTLYNNIGIIIEKIRQEA